MTDIDCELCGGEGYTEYQKLGDNWIVLDHHQISEEEKDNQNIVDRLHKQIKNLPACCSKECMGCDFDLLRHLFFKILEGKK